MKPHSVTTFVIRGAVAAVLMCLVACRNMDVVSKVGTSIGVATGTDTPGQAESIQRSGEAITKTFQDLTPEQVYYLGRAVGATILNQYSPEANDPATRYLNLVGQNLAQASSRPDSFSGYYFSILDSDEINAFAAPGGLIFVSRGMLNLCRNEDDVAAVLAHEIAHVAHQHGLMAIKKSRITSALTTLAVEGAKSFGGENLAQLTEAFEGSIEDITSTMMNAGYTRELERDADAEAIRILKTVGYDPSALVRLLRAMGPKLVSGRRDFATTHPPPADRIREISRFIPDSQPTFDLAARQSRFYEALIKK